MTSGGAGVTGERLASLAPPGPTAYHRLDPLTKATTAAAAALGAFAVGGFTVPIAILVVVVLPSAAAAALVGRVVRLAATAALPIAISVALVSVLTLPGATVLFTLGPFDATLEGAGFAAEVVVRLFTGAAALALFGLTTEPRAFVAGLERRGVPPRLAFASVATLEAIPRMLERGRAIGAAQRARGLDTEGRLLARVRGVLPIVGPAILSSIGEVEARGLALEARAFGRPGRRHPLLPASDSAAQRAVRWALVAGLVVLVTARVTGLLSGLP